MSNSNRVTPIHGSNNRRWSPLEVHQRLFCFSQHQKNQMYRKIYVRNKEHRAWSNIPIDVISHKTIELMSTFKIWTCEEVGFVRRVHLLSGEVRSVSTALKVVEEVQEEVQEIEDG